jgi:nicotinate-nucleotide adenylyltransferase
MEISSSEIRERVRKGQDISELVPEAVNRYIRENHLYLTDKTDGEKRQNLKKTLSSVLNPSRYSHTLGVAQTAAHLASLYGADAEKAYLSGLLHDCAKCYSDEELLSRCQEEKIPVTESEQKAPQLLHAKYGAWLAEHEYGVTDKEICAAIACHTTGKPGMNLLEKIIFAADYLEPGRKQAPHLNVLRKLAETDLDMTILCILQDTLEYLQEKNSAIDPMTRNTYQWMQTSLSEKGE